MIIELKENTGVKNIKNLYSDLKEIIEKDSDIVFDMSRLKRIDLALVQVFFALNSELMTRGKRITLRSVSGEIKNQLYLAGFSNKSNAGPVKAY